MSWLSRWERHVNPAAAEPVVAPDPLPVFCGVSGHRLELVSKAVAFDTATGREVRESWLVCPKSKHKDIRFFLLPEADRRLGFYGVSIRRVTCDGASWGEVKGTYSWAVQYTDCKRTPASDDFR